MAQRLIEYSKRNRLDLSIMMDTPTILKTIKWVQQLVFNAIDEKIEELGIENCMLETMFPKSLEHSAFQSKLWENENKATILAKSETVEKDGFKVYRVKMLENNVCREGMGLEREVERGGPENK